MREGNPHELLTVEDIKIEFKAAARRWHWQTDKLTAIWRTGGIVGEWDNTIKKHVFARWSIIEYINYVNRILDKQKVDPREPF